jgi:tetraacyldisaccharide 4'-kinase
VRRGVSSNVCARSSNPVNPMRATLPDTRLNRVLVYVPRTIYERMVRLRIALYRVGWLKTRRLQRPVISVGNITFGGTGKTPLVETIASALGGEGYRVAILTRGYGRRGKGRVVVRSSGDLDSNDTLTAGGDEPTLLARRVPGAVVIVDEDRFEAGRWAEAEIDPDVFVLDDGFQHLRLARDLNLLVVDATNPFGGIEMAPFGTLREPIDAMRRADAVVVTRASRPYDDALVRRRIRDVCGEEIPILYVDHEVRGFVPLGGGRALGVDSFRDRAVGVIAALGNPSVLLDDLSRVGARVVSSSLFTDHHDYTQGDLDGAIASARAAGAEAVLTTEKDAVKLERLSIPSMPVLVVDIAVRQADRTPLERLCVDAIRPFARQSPRQI